MVKSKHERGSALTEFAVMMPMIIGVFYASTFLIDLGLFKLKAQEIARYTTWGFTQAPLSEYESFNHNNAFSDAKERSLDELGALYADLDGARTRPSLLPGRSRQSMSAIFETPSAGDMRNEASPILPSVANVDFVDPLSLAGLASSALGVGPSTEAVASGFFKRVGMNDRGLVTGRSRVRVLPPWRAEDVGRAVAISQLQGGMDLRTQQLSTVGRLLRDEGRPIQNALIVDSWRATNSVPTLPNRSPKTDVAQVVARLHRRSGSALPLGGLLGTLLGIGGADDASKYVASRPYLAERSCSSVDRSGFVEAHGQFNPFARAGVTSSRRQERGAVANFETLPLFDDPRNMCSEQLKALNARGRFFMGCAAGEQRRCRQ